MGGDSVPRVEKLLGKLDAVRRSHERGSKVTADADSLSNEFIGQVERIFDTLHKSTDWSSFYHNDIKLVTGLPFSAADHHAILL